MELGQRLRLLPPAAKTSAAVAELGFGAGGRAAPEGVPDPELVEQAKRRIVHGEVQGGDSGRGGRVHQAG